MEELRKLIAEVDKIVAGMSMKKVLSTLNKIGYGTFEFKWSKGGLINQVGYEKFLEKNTSKIIESFKCRGVSLNEELDFNTVYMIVGNKLFATFSFYDYETKEDMDSEIRGFLERKLVEMQSDFYNGNGEDVLSKIK